MLHEPVFDDRLRRDHLHRIIGCMHFEGRLCGRLSEGGGLFHERLSGARCLRLLDSLEGAGSASVKPDGIPSPASFEPHFQQNRPESGFEHPQLLQKLMRM